MTFTTTPPTTPGFYAWRETKQLPEKLIRVRYETEFGASLLACYEPCIMGTKVEELGGLWCRLVPAEEVEKAWDEGLVTDKLEKLTYAQLTRDELYLKSHAKLIAEGKE